MIPIPDESRLRLDDPRRDLILALHAKATARGWTSYRDPDSGYRVFTAAYHLARGSCCDTGCRHCPYLG